MMAFGLAGACFAVSGCATAGYPEVSVAQANQELAGGYRLGPGDKLRVTVFDEPNLTGEYEVGAGGAVALPLIANVAASGVTPEALATAIGAKLAEGGYVLQPRVAVEVLNYRPFYILGEVNKPGEYPYAGQLTVLQAIAKAGGFTARANKGSVVVRRLNWQGAREVRVSETPLLLAPGDTVVVTESLF
jgi:polysaccharide export outer membrane protein